MAVLTQTGGGKKTTLLQLSERDMAKTVRVQKSGRFRHADLSGAGQIICNYIYIYICREREREKERDRERERER